VRWRQVVLLWTVVAVLAGEYWLVERTPPEQPAAPTRRRFLPVDVATVREVRIARGGRTIVSRRDAQGWTLVEPAAGPVPPDLIAAFAGALTSAEEIARVAGPEAATEQFGLDERAARVEVLTDASEPQVVTIGDPNPNGTAVYARRADGDVVLIGRQVRDYEDMLFRAVSAGHTPPAADQGAPVGG